MLVNHGGWGEFSYTLNSALHSKSLQPVSILCIYSACQLHRCVSDALGFHAATKMDSVGLHCHLFPSPSLAILYLERN